MRKLISEIRELVAVTLDLLAVFAMFAALIVLPSLAGILVLVALGYVE